MIKPVFRVSDHIKHKPSCTATEDRYSSKFWIKKAEGLYYQCSENKGADQLCRYWAADLRLCFHICKKQVFSSHSSIIVGSIAVTFAYQTEFFVYLAEARSWSTMQQKK